MNILEKIKELKALRAELGENDIEERQAYTDAIIGLVKQMAVIPETITAKPPETNTVQPVPQPIIKNGDFEVSENDVPEDSITQIKSRTRYIPQ